MRILWPLIIPIAVIPAWAQESPAPRQQTDADWVDDRFSKMDTGPFFSGTLKLPGRNVPKALVVRLDNANAGMCFDMELLTWRAGWTGGFVKRDPARFGLIGLPAPQGTICFTNTSAPGWRSAEGSWDDPRAEPLGPLDRAQGRWSGLYRIDGRVVLSYQVHDVPILEQVDCVQSGEQPVFLRTLAVGPRPEPLTFRVHDGQHRAAVILHRVSGAEVTTGQAPDGSTYVRVGRGQVPARITLAISRGTQAESNELADPRVDRRMDQLHSLDLHAAIADHSLMRRLWGEPIAAPGSLGTSSGPLAIDTLGVPYENPFHALMYLSGHDFFSNGDAAVTTAHGDVWRVRGIEADLRNISWQRLATGLFQPLGIRIVDDQIHVLGRDQLTILHDLNNDGEADFYENFNNEGHVTDNGHEYVSGLETDSAGNFYYLKCTSAGRSAHDGCLLRVSADGRGLDVVATGFRNPVGLGLGPNNVLTVADQQGEWVPSTRVDVVKPGGFYGYMPSHHRPVAPTTYDPPLCWLPHSVDNSAGGQVWLTGRHWGPLENQLVHLSYGRCSAMLLLRDEVNGVFQGAAVPLPGRFLAGAMRGRIHPSDGHLYITGLSGWQTAAVRDGCFQRIRYTGGKIYLPLAWSVHDQGLRLTFSEPLDPETAQDIESYSIEQWNYRWTEKYGSKDWSMADPSKMGRDPVPVTAATLSDDGRTVFLNLGKVRPVMQMEIRYNLDAADGQVVRGSIYATIHGARPPAGP
jgi:hypothetical protein